jgi:D-alanyl-D-alanine carboxypeptidase/D-alanyl-D-alanine-endopeptidase (penicillin-binding protein 4)
VHAWLARAGLDMPGLTLENGSGLSRREAIRATDLAAVLVHAWNGPEMPDFLASLPHAGVDGTMHARLTDGPQAWIKTGMLSDVRAAAGYVFSASGHRYAVVALLNGTGPADARPAIDGFLRWVWKKG